MAVARFPDPDSESAAGDRLGEPPPTGGPPPGKTTTGDYDVGPQFDMALSVIKSLADQEYDQADKISMKARQSFVFVAGFFGVVQVAVNSTSSKLNRGQLHAVLILAIVSAVFVAVTAVLAVRADALRRFQNLSSEDVLDSVNTAIKQKAPASFDLTQLYARVLDERRSAVTQRRWWLICAQLSAVCCVLLLAGELIVTLADRL